MNVYERIINILLEARVDLFMQDRLDEANLLDKGKSPQEKTAARDARHGAPASFRRQVNVQRRDPKGTPSTRTTNTGKEVPRESPRAKRRAMKRDAQGGVGPIPDAQRKSQVAKTGKPGFKADAPVVKARIKQAQAERQDKPKPQIP